jgi:ankyrin repeat protein
MASASVSVGSLDEEGNEELLEALRFAVEHQHLPTFRQLLKTHEHRLQDEPIPPLRCRDSDGHTALHIAAMAHPSKAVGEMIERLIDSRAEVDAQNILGETPLLLAMRAALDAPSDLDDGLWLHPVRCLLERRADVNAVDELNGETPLVEAACRGSESLCRVLLDFRADPAAEMANGVTALNFAESGSHKAVVKLLREAAGVDETDVAPAREAESSPQDPEQDVAAQLAAEGEVAGASEGGEAHGEEVQEEIGGSGSEDGEHEPDAAEVPAHSGRLPQPYSHLKPSTPFRPGLPGQPKFQYKPSSFPQPGQPKFGVFLSAFLKKEPQREEAEPFPEDSTAEPEKEQPEDGRQQPEEKEEPGKEPGKETGKEPGKDEDADEDEASSSKSDDPEEDNRKDTGHRPFRPGVAGVGFPGRGGFVGKAKAFVQLPPKPFGIHRPFSVHGGNSVPAGRFTAGFAAPPPKRAPGMPTAFGSMNGVGGTFRVIPPKMPGSSAGLPGNRFAGCPSWARPTGGPQARIPRPPVPANSCDKHYRTLGLPPGAKADAVRSAYRKLALQYHPDKNKDLEGANEKFREIKEAYEAICRSLG